MTPFDILKEFGLSPLAIRCYQLLLKESFSTTQQLSEQLGLPAINLYNPLNLLVKRGFVIKYQLTIRPTRFRTLPLDQALPNHYMRLRQAVLPFCQAQNIEFPPALPPQWLKKLPHVP